MPLDIPNAGKKCETWYKIVGDIEHGVPLITLHGGKQRSHNMRVLSNVIFMMVSTTSTYPAVAAQPLLR